MKYIYRLSSWKLDNFLKLLTVNFKYKNFLKTFYPQTQIPWKITSVVHFIMSYVDPALDNIQILFCFIIWLNLIQHFSLAVRGLESSILAGACRFATL